MTPEQFVDGGFEFADGLFWDEFFQLLGQAVVLQDFFAKLAIVQCPGQRILAVARLQVGVEFFADGDAACAGLA